MSDKPKWSEIKHGHIFNHPGFGKVQVCGKGKNSVKVTLPCGKTTLIMKDVVMRSLEEK